jgi:protein-L-isoaspartate(D-aspartate) O-methyltransferase
MDFAERRRNMVEGQLRTNKVIDDRLIAAMGKIAREAYVPARLAGIAYVDEDIPLGGGKYLMEPMVFARLVQGLALNPGDRVLIVGDFSGYASLVMFDAGTPVLPGFEKRPSFAL